MSKPSRRPTPPPFPVELVAELDALCVERERTKGRSQSHEGALRAQRIEELQAQLLQFPQPVCGSVVAGAQLERVIEAGSLGTVWLAQRVDSGVTCAVKVFHQHCASRGRMLRHFRQGIAALRVLTARGAPPSIVQLLGADDSQLAFSMTLVAGHALTDIARRGWTMEKKMQVFSGICEAVRFAHQKGILHGDLRPANILYDDPAGCPVLTDFDLADVSALEPTTSPSRWLYAAPEQRQGRGQRLLESDIYSLGQLLRYLITERDPEEGTGLGVGEEAIARIIATCTRPEPGERYGDVDELQGEVRRWRAGLNVEAVRQSPHPPTQLPPPELPALTLKNEAQDKPRYLAERMVAWGAMATVVVGGAIFAARYWSGLGSSTAALDVARSPDAGAVAAPKKKPSRPKKRSRVADAQKGDGAAIASDAISRLFRDNSAAFQRCHSDADVPLSDLIGRVTTRFRVDADGVLSEAKVQETTVRASAVAKCVASTHNGLRLDSKPALATYAQSRYDIGPMPD